MLIQQANLEDILGVLALLSANHVNNVENKADDFVTTNMTAEQLAALITKEKR